MNLNDDLRVLLPTDREAVYALAKHALTQRVRDPMDAEMESWSSRWRLEALDHYLALGWSYGYFENNQLAGFLLAQPIVFHRGYTQTLWVEHVEAPTPEIAEKLVDCAKRWARDKRFQRVIFDDKEVKP